MKRKEKYKTNITIDNYKKFFSGDAFMVKDDAEFVEREQNKAQKKYGIGDEYDWKYWIERYLDRKIGQTKTVKPLSPKTIIQNRQILYPYYDWLTEYDKSSTDIFTHIDYGVEWFKEYYSLRLSGEVVDERVKKKWSPASVHKAYRNIKGFYNWVAQSHKDNFPIYILRKLQMPQATNKRDAINSEEFEKIIDFIIQKKDDVYWGKFLLLLRLQLKTGMRVGELVNIRNRNIDVTQKKIGITGKGEIDRTLNFISEADEVIWNDIIKKKHDGLYLFHRTKIQFYPTQKKFIEIDRDVNKPTTESYYMQRFRDMRDLLGLRGKGIITSHSLRRYFITQYVKMSGNRDLVMQIVGHKSRRMTDYYLSNLIDDKTTTTIDIGIR